MKGAIIATLSFMAGGAFGAAISYFLLKDKLKKESDEQLEAVVAEVRKYKEDQKEQEPEAKEEKVPYTPNEAKIAMPGKDGINYTKYSKIVADQGYAEEEHPTDDDEEDDDYHETYEERVQREVEEAIENERAYKEAHRGKIELLKEDEYYDDFPEVVYEHEELFYFQEVDELYDADGNKLDNKEKYVGNWFTKLNFKTDDSIKMYVRNNILETDYKITKEPEGTPDDFF